MRVTTPPLRKALAAAGTGAAMIAALGASASAANAAEAVIHYTCNVPLIGNQPLYVDVQAPTFPSNAVVGQPTAPFDISAASVTGGNTYLAISLTGTAKLTDASAGFAGTTQALVTQSDGSTIPVTVPVSIGSYNVPSSAPLRLTATGTSPAVTPTVAGAAKVTVGNLALNLRAFKADGTPVALGSASDSDGDVNSFDMACTVAAPGAPSSGPNGEDLGTIGSAQDTTLGTINVQAPDTPPTKPGTPSVSNIGENSADVSWAASTDNGSVTGYDVYLNGSLAKSVTGTSTTLSGLTASTSYTVTVIAKDDTGNSSAASDPASFTTATPPPVDNPPSAPGNLAASNITETSADLNWDASSDDNGVTGYQVFIDGTKVADVSGTSASVSGLTASTTYTATVKAVDTAGQLSDSSNAVSFTTATPPPVDNPPSAPGKPDVSNITETTADVSWAAATDDNGVTGYQVFVDGTKVADASGTSTTLTGLTASTSYSVTVKAVDTVGQLSDASGATSFTTATPPPVDNPPSAPGKPSVANVTQTTADVSWAAATDDNGVSSYEVLVNGSQVATTTTPSYTLTGLSASTSYSVSVKAVDTAGQEGPASASTSFTTSAAPDTQGPTKPGTPTGTSSSTSVSLNWGASSDNVGVTGYDVYQDGSKVKTVSGTTATITGLTADTSYSFKVQAFDAAGNTSDFSDSVSVKTQPAPSNNLNVKFNLTGSTFLKGGNGSAALKGGIDAVLDLTTGNFSADMTLNPTVAHLKILGFLPVDAKVNFSQAAKTTGTFTNGVLSATAKVNIKIPSATTFGIQIAGGPNCGTATPATIPLKSGAGFSPVGGGTVSGTYTMPAITNCGLLTPLLSYLTAVPGNTMTANLTPAS